MFDINKYLGTWYEIMRYPSWFEPVGSYNTIATYTINEDGSINVFNSTIDVKGENIVAHGRATVVNPTFNFIDGKQALTSLSVSFDGFPHQEGQPNYLIDNIFVNNEGEYIYSIVSDPARDSLFVLSKYPTSNIRLETMMKLLEYLSTRYDLGKIIHVPHYMITL